MEKIHPAAEWAIETAFNSTQVDCTTAVVLKILDKKCKMLPGEQAAVLAIYDAVRERPGELFDTDVHRQIDEARLQPEAALDQIHTLRVHAEAVIPKPVMKEFKALLRYGLFG